MNNDLRFLKDQLVNAWEVTDQAEMQTILTRETDYPQDAIGSMVDHWYLNTDNFRIEYERCSDPMEEIFEDWILSHFEDDVIFI